MGGVTFGSDSIACGCVGAQGDSGSSREVEKDESRAEGTCMYMCICICMYACVCVCMYVYVVSMYMYIVCMRMCVCMYVYVVSMRC